MPLFRKQTKLHKTPFVLRKRVLNNKRKKFFRLIIKKWKKKTFPKQPENIIKKNFNTLLLFVLCFFCSLAEWYTANRYIWSIPCSLYNIKHVQIYIGKVRIIFNTYSENTCGTFALNSVCGITTAVSHIANIGLFLGVKVRKFMLENSN